jgi:two-component system OmpR family response regulator
MVATSLMIPKSARTLTSVQRGQAPKLLVVDDDADLCILAAELLSQAGYEAFTASDGQAMAMVLDTNAIDLIVLDLNLPGEDGLSLCRAARRKRDIPIIMLTARSEPVDKVIGLEVGADDYITKPFDPREFVARVRSVLRRTSSAPSVEDVVSPTRALFRGWVLDLESRCLTDPSHRSVALSGNEFCLLQFFVEHANEILTREQILTLTADPSALDVSEQRLADLHISRLRQKLNDPDNASGLILTVRNRGYVLAAGVTFE